MVEINSGDILSTTQINQNLRVFAGPGAGKTHFLVQNIKNIISTNEVIKNGKNRKILCITYTNAAADEITNRLKSYTEALDVYTIHSFIINNIIKPFQEDLRNIIKFDFDVEITSKGSITSQIEGLGILHGVDKEEIFEFVKNKTNETKDISYSKKIMGEIEVDCKSFCQSIKEAKPAIRQLKSSQSIKENHRIPIKEFIWNKVKKLTHDEILYFGYRIIETNPLALYYLRVKYPYIFIDEFQDTNPLQTLLIKTICKKATRVCVVGDMAQSIYRFQGASPSDFDDFHIDDSDIDFSIKNNRRSSTNIVNFCNFLRQADTVVVQESVKASLPNNKIHFLLGESDNIKSIIDNVLDDGGVILTRTWAAAFKYIKNIDIDQVELLKKIYSSYYFTPISIRDEIIELNNVSWVRAFKFIFKLWQSYKNGTLIDFISALELYGKVRYERITPKKLIKVKNLLEEVFVNCEKVKTCDILSKFNDTVNKEQYSELHQLLDVDRFEISVFDELEREDLKKNIQQLNWSTSYKLFTEVFTENSKYMTVHQAKGLEWKNLVVSVEPTKNDKIKLTEMYSNPQIKGDNDLSEFVRIYYVACSRAIENLYIHIPDKSTRACIENSLNSFITQRKLHIDFEFLE